METTNIYLRFAGVDVKGATDNLDIEIPKDQVANVINFKK